MDRRQTQATLFLLAGLLPALVVSRGTAQAPAASAAEGVAFFEKQIQPILAENCFKCHSHAAKKSKGGLVLDSQGGFLKGGDSGPAVVPGEPDKSRLIQAIRQTDELKMPPGKKLSDAQIALLVRWVKMGAPAPDTGKVVKARGAIADEDRAWWAFQPMRQPKVPQVADHGWARNEIDRFILHKLRTEGLSPAPEADRQTLI